MGWITTAVLLWYYTVLQDGRTGVYCMRHELEMRHVVAQLQHMAGIWYAARHGLGGLGNVSRSLPKQTEHEHIQIYTHTHTHYNMYFPLTGNCQRERGISAKMSSDGQPPPQAQKPPQQGKLSPCNWQKGSISPRNKSWEGSHLLECQNIWGWT